MSMKPRASKTDQLRALERENAVLRDRNAKLRIAAGGQTPGQSPDVTDEDIRQLLSSDLEHRLRTAEIWGVDRHRAIGLMAVEAGKWFSGHGVPF